MSLFDLFHKPPDSNLDSEASDESSEFPPLLSPPDFPSLRVSREGTLVLFSGEMDLHSIFACGSLLQEAGSLALQESSEVVVDLSAVFFIDSAGLMKVVALLKQLRDSSASIKVIVLEGSQPAYVLKLGRWDSLFPIVVNPKPDKHHA